MMGEKNLNSNIGMKSMSECNHNNFYFETFKFYCKECNICECGLEILEWEKKNGY